MKQSSQHGPVHDSAVFRKEFEGVRRQVTTGNAHLELWKGLSKRLNDDSKRLVATAAPAFFGMTLEAHLNTAILHAARIFDTQARDLSIKKILKRAKALGPSLSKEAQSSLGESLDYANASLPNLEAALKAVRTRRNKTLAHLDPGVISSPDEIIATSKLTVSELQNIFHVAWEILNGISAPFWDYSFAEKLIGVDDYATIVDLIEKARKRQREEYEAEFGPFPDAPC